MENGYILRQLKQFFSTELPMKLVLFNTIVLVCAVSGFISLFISLLIDMPVAKNFLAIFCMAVLAYSFYLANFRDRLEDASFLTVFGVAVIGFPAMFATGGGIASGTPVWFALSIAFTCVLLDGNRLRNMIFFEVVIYTFLLFAAYAFPQSFPQTISRTGRYITIWQSILICAFALGAVIRWQTHIYRQTLHKYEEQEKELEKQKQEAVKAFRTARGRGNIQSRLIFKMSQEVRMPPNAVLGMDELILRQTKDSEIKAYALHLRNAGQSLLSFATSVLDFFKLETGKLKISVARYDIAAMLKQVVEALPPLNDTGVTFSFTGDRELPSRLVGDNARVGQIVLAALDGMIKDTHKGDVELAVNFEPIDDNSVNLIFRITYNGLHYDPARLKLFQNFFSDKAKKYIEGEDNFVIALSLTVVKQIADLLDGEIRIEDIPDMGTILTFRLVQEVADWTPCGDKLLAIYSQRSVETLYRRRFTAPLARVLFVDDVPINLLFVKKFLSASEIKAETAESGAACLKLLQKKRYHVIFINRKMHGMDGSETLWQMRSLPGNRNVGVPVVMMRDNAAAALTDADRVLGFREVMAKPIKGVELENMILKFLPASIVHFIEADEQAEDEESAAGPIAIAAEAEDEISQSIPAFLHPLCRLIPELEVEQGLSYCVGDADFYREMLKDYATNRRSEEMERFFAKEDWENYGIQAHALKSTSLTIGHRALSEEAKSLELAAKDGDIDFIKGHHPEVINLYRDFLGRLSAFLDGAAFLPNTGGDIDEDRRKTILIADSDEASGKAIKDALGEAFYNLNEVKTARDLFAFLDTKMPDLIMLSPVLDGDIDGFSVLEQLRLEAAWQNIPVFFLALNDDKDAILKALRLGASDIIRHPFVGLIIRRRVRNITDLSVLRDNMDERVEIAARDYLERSEDALELARETIESLAMAVDASSRYLKGHSFRVAICAQEIAKRLGCPEVEQRQLYFMGLVYDVGKLAIPYEILEKKGRLREEELSVLQRHTILGEAILSRVTRRKEFAEAARYHHERYDGMGYPSGLIGESIPLFARILAAADAYDAMMSERPYRRPLPLPDIREEFEKESGHQFDPAIVPIVLGLIDEKIANKDTAGHMAEKDEEI